MKPLFKASAATQLFRFLLVLLMVKIFYFIIEIGLLETKDTDYIADEKIKPLHYTVRFASTSPVKKVKPIKHMPKLETMKNYQLLSVYHSDDNDVVTVKYRNKTQVLARGEAINGFVLVFAGANFAVFEKNGKEYRLLLKHTDENTWHTFSPEADENMNRSNGVSVRQTEEVVKVDETHRLISRKTLERYTTNLEEVYKNIGLSDVRKNGKIEGFKVTFIRRGSVFAKLGLKRGDILLAINGEPLTSYKAAFDAYRNITDVTDATITIKRGNKTMELEYEIN